jgi:hypothetical protein
VLGALKVMSACPLPDCTYASKREVGAVVTEIEIAGDEKQTGDPCDNSIQ